MGKRENYNSGVFVFEVLKVSSVIFTTFIANKYFKQLPAETITMISSRHYFGHQAN